MRQARTHHRDISATRIDLPTFLPAAARAKRADAARAFLR